MTLDRLRVLIQSAVDQSVEGYTVDEVERELAEGNSVLFATHNSILITQLQQHHDVITGHAWLAAGSLDEIMQELMPRALDWARAEGAARVTLEGREGWVRALEKHGFKRLSVTVGMEL